MSAFLERVDIRVLTGFALKEKQAAQLRKMGLPFFLNGAGWPVVTLSAVQGNEQAKQAEQWQPNLLKMRKTA